MRAHRIRRELAPSIEEGIDPLADQAEGIRVHVAPFEEHRRQGDTGAFARGQTATLLIMEVKNVFGAARRIDGIHGITPKR